MRLRFLFSITFFVFTMAISGCTKDYSCHCVQHNLADGSALEDYENVEAKNESSAKEKCDNMDEQWGAYTKDCTLE